jgi:hypothetical protein
MRAVRREFIAMDNKINVLFMTFTTKLLRKQSVSNIR